MNCLILNDTRSDHHIGCELVIRNTLQQCQSNHINVVATITTKEAQQAPEIIKQHMELIDIVLLNGEGTLHDDKPNALSLLEAAKAAKEKGLKVVLYNALWANNVKAAKYLHHFDLIFCRDKDSTQEIKRQHPEARVETVPDMTFITDLPSELSNNATRLGTLVTDSVRKAKCIQLSKYAVKHGSMMAPMSDSFFRKLKKKPLLRWKLHRNCKVRKGKYDTPDEFLKKLLNTEAVLTGRFHTVCLSLVCGAPVYCLASNTRKIQSLLQDFGLDSSAVSNNIPPQNILEQQWIEHREKAQSIQHQVTLARKKIESMFESIASL